MIIASKKPPATNKKDFTVNEVIKSNAAPLPIGPYSQAVRNGDLLFVSGQLGMDPETGEMVSDSVADQTRQALANLAAIAAAAGTDLYRTLKTTIFVIDMSKFAEVNQVYGTIFGHSYPARSTVEVSALPKNGMVEIEAIVAMK